MPTHRILIVYASSHGQTEKIARRMADLLSASGHSVSVADTANLPRDLDPGNFDGVIVGASINYGRHQRSAVRFVRAHRDALNAMPSAFFSVSGSAASPQESGRAAARECLDAFLKQTGWQPQHAEIVAGNMAYTKYSPFIRWLTSRIARKSGGPTDTSRDHEFTDWTQVEQFARALAGAIRPRDVRTPALV